MTNVDLDAVERAIREHHDPVVTAGELAEPLDCSSRHILDLLRLLERSGAVESKQTGARAVAWWHVERVRPPRSHEGTMNEQPTNDEGAANERQGNDVVRPTEPASESPTEPEENEIDTTDEIEQAVDAAAEQWDDPPERMEQRKQAARAVLAAIREQPLSKSEIIEEVEPQHSVEGQSKRTWWRKNLSECSPSPLKTLAEYSNSTKKWKWTDED